jgi:hypothetical protein
MGCPYCFAYVLDIKVGRDRDSAWLSQKLPLTSEGCAICGARERPKTDPSVADLWLESSPRGGLFPGAASGAPSDVRGCAEVRDFRDAL